ncbi:MAG: restriction endonuclease subunit S [Phenylobacterium sp.]|nr:restriction endonuclease subunit S [Phenylobacterium sp.]MCA3751702.1 restriction endonuclease subunit S [Phenylobacterium sp.]MCA6228794.1 restriction endonuclease subunit S [Phenylobacterium sp.]MCA6241933.1 restriction endonuclease subunit S [Phenylobacterium sp.]
MLTPGEIYVSLKDVTQSADLLGAVARVPSYIPLGRLTQDTVKLVFKAEDAPRTYLYWLLQTPQYREFCRAHSTGTTNLGLAREDFLNFEVPPLTRERQWIVGLVQNVEDKIELNRRMNETLEAMAQAIFRDWFVDFGPVRRKLEGATDPVAIMGGLVTDPVRAAELAGLFPDSIGDDDLPVGWSERPIGDLVDIAGGSTPSTADDSLWQPAEHRWATPKDLSNMSDLALFDTGRRISSAGLAKITSGLLPAGTVLLSSRAPIGYLAIAQAPVAINQGFIALKPTADFGGAYLYLWCKVNMEAILANANGSTFQEISKKNFRPIVSAVPDDRGVCRAFGEIANPMFARIVSAAAENRTLAETRNYLLPRLMTGEVRVSGMADTTPE